VPQLDLSGTLSETPSASSDGAFPSTTTTIPFAQNTGSSSKPVQVSTGRRLLQVNSPDALVQILGDADDPQVATLYARVASGGFQFRATYANPSGDPIVSVLPSAGLCILEPDAGGGYYVTTFEVRGAGLLECYAAGLDVLPPPPPT
jgi:hypothetical protein